MASVKIKFRPSTTDGGQGTLFYRVIHNRIARQQKTGYRLHADEWDSNLSEVVLPSADGNRKTYLSEIRNSVAADIRRFHKVIDTLEVSGHAYSADDVMAGFYGGRAGKPSIRIHGECHRPSESIGQGTNPGNIHYNAEQLQTFQERW